MSEVDHKEDFKAVKSAVTTLRENAQALGQDDLHAGAKELQRALARIEENVPGLLP